jgi:uncharacterized membrane protein
MAFHERHHRTLFKSISWFVVGFIVSVAVLWYFSGDLMVAMEESLVIQGFKFLFFYLHERVWNKTHFGKEHRANGLKYSYAKRKI